MNELHLFAGAGGGILGSELLGIRTVCAVELEPYPASVLLARQNDGLLPPFPIWDDVRTFDGKPWRGIVDLVSGGFPCQDISAAGKGAGIDGERSGLWREMLRIINEVRPKFAFLENSPMLVRRGLTRVLGDLTEVGYDAEWCVLGADDVGAPHVRKRIWILAHDSHTCIQRLERQQCALWQQAQPRLGVVRSHVSKSRTDDGRQWWTAEPDVGRVAHGVAARVDRLKALGNGQVPAVAATAFRILLGRIKKGTEEE